MNRLVLLAFIVCSLLSVLDGKLYPLAVRLPLLGEPAFPGESIWPAPSQLTLKPGVYTLDKDKFRVDYQSTLNNCEKEILQKLWEHYANVVFPPEPIAFAKPSSGSEQMNTLSFKLTKIGARSASGAKADCKSPDYYPVIEDLELEACKFSFFMTQQVRF